MSRIFGRIERFVWNDERFRGLPPDAQFLWLYLLSTPYSTMCPGLIVASEVAIGEHLGWVDTGNMDTLVDGINRTKGAMEHLQKPIGTSENGWIEYDRNAKVLLLRRAVVHDPPRTTKQIKGWLARFREIPRSALKRTWLEMARDVVASQYGHTDSRAVAFDTLLRSVVRQGADALEPSPRAFDLAGDRLQENATGGPLENLERPLKNLERPLKNLGNESVSLCGSAEKTLPPSQPSVIVGDFKGDSNQEKAEFETIINNTITSTSKNNRDPKKRGAGAKRAARIQPPVGAKFVVDGKPQEPPGGFNSRQRQAWEAMRTATFYVPGRGPMTAWQAVADPVLLAGQLGGDAYPGVDMALIHRLGNWTMENHSRAKKEVARFLMNRFSASQERGSFGARGGQNDHTGNGTVDLEAKVQKMKGERR